MVSKKQAAAIGEALAHGNRKQSRQRPYRFRLYPELERIPEVDRDIALQDAQWHTVRSWPIAVLACCLTGFLAFIWLAWESESPDISQLTTIGVFIVSFTGWVFRTWVRKELRRSAWRLPSPSLELPSDREPNE